MFGVLDPAFGVGGVITTAGWENAKDILITPNGLNILMVGDQGNDGMIALFKG